MEYEIHITVEAFDKDKFKTDCLSIGVKPIVIDTIVDKEQVMTSSKHKGVDYISDSTLISDSLKKLGYNILRIKVELYPQENIKHLYLESHLRLKLPIDYKSFDNIKQIAQKHKAHLSKNSFKVDDKFKWWMLTLRDRTSTIDVFKRIVMDLNNDLSEIYTVDKIEIEQCVFDTNESIDSKWLSKS